MKSVNGDDILYRFMSELIESNDEVAEEVVAALVRSTSIWFPTSLYSQIPVLLPWVVRDPSCRPKVQNGQKTAEEWSSPNEGGYLRDDNSLVKAIQRSLVISGGSKHLADQKLGRGWVACHIWRQIKHPELATRHPRTNSFIPNLVWLPRQLAKLSDRENGPVQVALQRASWGIYRQTKVRDELDSLTEEIWSLIPEPDEWDALEPSAVHLFDCSERFVASRRKSLVEVIGYLGSLLEDSEPKAASRLPSRYRDGLALTDRKAIELLHAELLQYA